MSEEALQVIANLDVNDQFHVQEYIDGIKERCEGYVQQYTQEVSEHNATVALLDNANSTIEEQEKTIRQLEWQRDGLMSLAEALQHKLSQSNKERDRYREALEKILKYSGINHERKTAIEYGRIAAIGSVALKEGEEDES